VKVRVLCAALLLSLPMGCASTAGPASAPSAETTASGADHGVVLPVQIAAGTVTPTNQRLDAKVGEQVTLRVDSDTEEEVHVHSEPGHTFAVKPVPGQVFTFSVSIPGKVAIELHHSDKTIATLQVRP